MEELFLSSLAENEGAHAIKQKLYLKPEKLKLLLSVALCSGLVLIVLLGNIAKSKFSTVKKLPESTREHKF